MEIPDQHLYSINMGLMLLNAKFEEAIPAWSGPIPDSIARDALKAKQALMFVQSIIETAIDMESSPGAVSSESLDGQDWQGGENG